DGGSEQRIEPRAGIPFDNPGQHCLVEYGDERDEDSTEDEHADEQVWGRQAIGDCATGPIPDREPCEDDPDQRSPDVERAAKARSDDAARLDLEPEEDRSGEEDGVPDRAARAALAAHAETLAAT